MNIICGDLIAIHGVPKYSLSSGGIAGQKTSTMQTSLTLTALI